MAETKIEWTDKVWNPVTGCTKVSAGCKNCYAEKVADRFWETQYDPIQEHNGERFVSRARRFTDVQTHPDRLDQPLRWRTPQRIFVNSMSDLFHEAVGFAFILKAFFTMRHARQHTFQVLTKRPKQMQRFFNYYPHILDWPLPNVHLGVSVEDQTTEDERVPHLLETPASIRFVSYEPALGPVQFRNPSTAIASHLDGLDGVIVGGESGPGARPCNIEWIRSVVGQCREAGVPCFVKQLGAQPRGWCVSRLVPGSIDAEDGFCDSYESGEGGDCGNRCFMLKHPKGGDMAEWPADLRVRELPAGREG